jgi:hypothetical protein
MNEMMRIPELRCVACNSKLNTKSDERRNHRPMSGDYTICIYCDELMAFTDDLTLRGTTEEEYNVANRFGGVTDARERADEYRRKLFRTSLRNKTRH